MRLSSESSSKYYIQEFMVVVSCQRWFSFPLEHSLGEPILIAVNKDKNVKRVILF